VKQEITDRYCADSLRVLIVWSPMMDADNEAAAREAAEMFGADVLQFYDPGRRVGRAYREKVFPDASRQALASLPDHHWLRERYSGLGESFATRPEWDIYLFYAPAIRWEGSPPVPTHFARHIGRFGVEGGDPRSVVWVDGYDRPPVEGALSAVLGGIAREMLRPAPRPAVH
jgi:hypothetical protein